MELCDRGKSAYFRISIFEFLDFRLSKTNKTDRIILKELDILTEK